MRSHEQHFYSGESKGRHWNYISEVMMKVSPRVASWMSIQLAGVNELPRS